MRQRGWEGDVVLFFFKEKKKELYFSTPPTKGTVCKKTLDSLNDFSISSDYAQSHVGMLSIHLDRSIYTYRYIDVLIVNITTS